MTVPSSKRVKTETTASSKRRVEKGGRATNKNVNISARASSLRIGYFSSHIGGFPQRYNETLRFANAPGVVVALGASAYSEAAVVVLNGTYRPCTGLSATAAAGFDKLMAIYTKCYVRAARIKMSACLMPTTVSSIVVGITGTTNSTTLGTYALAVEAGFEKHLLLGPNTDSGSVSVSVDIGKYLGRDLLTNTSDLYCTTSANPSQVVDAHLWFQNNTATACTYTFTIEVDYDCVFTDPLPVA